MKYLPTIASILLGLMFIAFGALFLLKMMPAQDPPPEGSLPALFMGALYPSGYLHFVKILEVLGGILLLIPLTRNIGLLVLGPIIINILAFHIFILKGAMLVDPVLIAITVLALFLLWAERKAFAGLVRR